MSTLRITGRARTDGAQRYLKQLVSHLGEKLPTTLSKAGGTVRYESAVAELTVAPAALEFSITADESLHLFRTMGIVQGHLEKFGAKSNLSCEWDDRELEAAYVAKRDEMAAQRQREVEAEREAGVDGRQ